MNHVEISCIADQIQRQLNRLGLSGLIAKPKHIFNPDNHDLVIVEVFDDLITGFYDAIALLDLLREYKPEDITASPGDRNIWSYLSEIEL